MIRTVLVVLLVVLSVPAGGHAATTYRQPVSFEWNRAHLNTIIVPPEHGQIINGNGALNGGDPAEVTPLQNSYLRAIEDSIADWHRAIDRFAPTWLKNGFTNSVYVLGRDQIPPEVIRAVNILVVTDPNKTAALGLALTLGARCLVANSRFFVTSMTEADMYNINAQEYGHCLGLGHVNEASPPNPPNDGNIIHDPMNGAYPHSPGTAGTHRHCASNLNIKGMQEVFRLTLQEQFAAPDGTIDKSNYQQINC